RGGRGGRGGDRAGRRRPRQRPVQAPPGPGADRPRPHPGHDAGAVRGGGRMSRLRPVAVPWSAAWLILGLLGAACATRPSADPLRGPLRSSRITFQLAVYYLPAPTSDPLPRLDSLVARDFPGLRRVAQLPATDRGRFVAARMERDVQGSYVP